MSTGTGKGRGRLTDWHLWTEVKRTVTPLRPLVGNFTEERPLPLPDPAGAPRTPPVFDRSATWRGPALPPYQAPPQKRTGEPGHSLEPRLRRRVRRGQIEIDATIDLHGMRQAEARAALERFILARSGRGDRTLLVITGKGLRKTEDYAILDRGVLRAMLPMWLAEPALAPYVAGFDIAAQGHGGEGAFYVRLRRGAR
ncbi:MAG: Smr/MutS family protein [Devosia sp.]